MSAATASSVSASAKAVTSSSGRISGFGAFLPGSMAASARIGDLVDSLLALATRSPPPRLADALGSQVRISSAMWASRDLADLAAHDDGDDAAVAVRHRRDEVEARGAGVAGLDAVDALDAAEQAIVVGEALLAVFERAGGEVGIVLRIVLAQRDAQRRHVARGGALRRVGQAVGVAEDGAGHAELARLGRHHAERNSSSEPPRSSPSAVSGVVGRLGHQRQDCRLDGHRAARLDAELGRRLLGGVLGERNLGCLLDLARLQRLEGEVKRHHLGQRGRIARGVGARREQRLAGVGIDHDGRVFRVGLRGRNGHAGDGQRSQRGERHLAGEGKGPVSDASQQLTHCYTL